MGQDRVHVYVCLHSLDNKSNNFRLQLLQSMSCIKIDTLCTFRRGWQAALTLVNQRGECFRIRTGIAKNAYRDYYLICRHGMA